MRTKYSDTTGRDEERREKNSWDFMGRGEDGGEWEEESADHGHQAIIFSSPEKNAQKASLKKRHARMYPKNACEIGGKKVLLF